MCFEKAPHNETTKTVVNDQHERAAKKDHIKQKPPKTVNNQHHQFSPELSMADTSRGMKLRYACVAEGSADRLLFRGPGARPGLNRAPDFGGRRWHVARVKAPPRARGRVFREVELISAYDSISQRPMLLWGSTYHDQICFPLSLSESQIIRDLE